MREYLRLDKVWLEKQLIFVCHSMGGIVARRFLISEQADIIDSNKRIGFFLVASPSLGSAYANFVKAIAPIYNMQLDALRFSQTNAWLNALDRDFINLKERRRVSLFGKELVEDNFIISRRFFRRAQIVPPYAGAKYFGEPLRVAHSDHMTIAKPENSKALQHRVLVEFVRSAIDGLPPGDTAADDTSDAIAVSKSEVVERQTLISSPKSANNPVLLDWPPELKPTPVLSRNGRKFNFKVLLSVTVGCLSMALVAPLVVHVMDEYRFERALGEPSGRQVLSGIKSWDKLPRSMQQPIAGGLSDLDLAQALRERGTLRLEGSEIQVGWPGSQTQAALYVHTLELVDNSSFVTNGNIVTIVVARIISQGGKIVSFSPQNLTASKSSASGLSGGEVKNRFTHKY